MATCNAQGTAYGPCAGEVLPAPDDCTTMLDQNCDGITTACAAPLWSKRFGGAADDVGHDVAIDTSGNIATTGYFNGSVDFGGGALVSTAMSNDIYIAKYDTAGAHLWSKRFGDAADQHGRGVAFDPAGNVFASGPFSGAVDFGGGALASAGLDDIFLVKLDPAGGHLWSKRFGDAALQTALGRNLAVDPNGDPIITGTVQGSIDFGGGALTSAGGDDVFVAKFSAAGAYLWGKRFGDASNQVPRGMAVDGSGNVVIVGTILGTIDFGCGLLTSAGARDVFVAKLSPAGACLWSKRFGDAADQTGRGAAFDPAGNLYVVGDFGGTIDFGGGVLTTVGGTNMFVAKFDAAGGHLWSKRYGTGGVPRALS